MAFHIKFPKQIRRTANKSSNDPRNFGGCDLVWGSVSSGIVFNRALLFAGQYGQIVFCHRDDLTVWDGSSLSFSRPSLLCHKNQREYSVVLFNFFCGKKTISKTIIIGRLDSYPSCSSRGYQLKVFHESYTLCLFFSLVFLCRVSLILCKSCCAKRC